MSKYEVERIKILEMIANHQISSEEGLSLIKKLQSHQGDNLDDQTKTRIDSPRAAKSDNHSTLYYQSLWEKSNFIPATIESKQGECILIFAENNEVASVLQKRLQSRIVLVKPGAVYCSLDGDIFEINPRRFEDYRRFIEELGSRQLIPRSIIHLWSQENFTASEQILVSQMERGIYSIFNLSLALMTRKYNLPIRFLYIFVTPRDDGRLNYAIQPQYAAVSGFVKTISQENPLFAYQTIEVRKNQEIEPLQLSELLEKELNQDTFGVTEVRYEDGNRLVKRFKEVEITKTNTLPLRNKGAYLITGGTGGLGLIFAKYLAKEVQAKLILVGRSDIDEHKRQQLQELELLGSQVMYIQADVSKRLEVEGLIKKVKGRFKELHGIIHSAGFLQDSFLIKKTRVNMEAVLAPKVFGTIYLDEFTQKEPLDFFVLFSSLTAVLGNVGQSDYAFGNCFMDEFAQRRNVLKHPGRTLSINWPLWQEGGMSVTEATISQMTEAIGLLPLSTENGIKAFRDGLESTLTQLIVFSGDEEKIKKWIDFESEIKSTASRIITLSEGEKAEFQEKTEFFLKQILSQQAKLPITKINSTEHFEKYGIDSVMIIGLNRELEHYFGSLSKTLFFEYQNITDLAHYFVENHLQKLVEEIGAVSKVVPALIIPESKTSSRQLRDLRRTRLIDPQPERDQVAMECDKDIAIIGISGRYPQAKNIDEFWENLKAGRDCIIEIPSERWDYHRYFDPDKNQPGTSYSKWGGFIDGVDLFDPLFFNISPKEAEYMDPQERLFLEIAWHTIEDAGYTRSKLAKNVGVFVGVMYGQYQLFGVEETQKGNIVANASSYAAIANRVSYVFDFQGPSIAIDTMCSSSLTAIHLACESIFRGECGVAIAGGVNLTIHPIKYLQLSQGKFAASDGKCHSFGEGGDGYVPGEGIGAVLLKPLKKAVMEGDHIYAVIKGTSVNHGGKTNGFSVPNPNAQANLINNALKKSNVDPRTISYIEAHGTGTSLGDPIEITGLAKAFKEYTQDQQYCSIGSAKSNIGHLESAAGIAGLTKVILQMKYRQLVPSIHSEHLNPNISFKESPFYVQHELADWKPPFIKENGIEREYPRRAGISSFGAGGSNAHIIIEEYQDSIVKAEQESKTRVLVFSAKTTTSMKTYLRDMLIFIEKLGDFNGIEAMGSVTLSDIAYTLYTGREEMDHRLAIVAESKKELLEKLTGYVQSMEEAEGVYHSSPQTKAAKSKALIEGETGEAFINALIQKGELNKLAKLWVSGVTIHWELLYSNDLLKRVSLPVYPFDKERYWIPILENKNNPGWTTHLHPLIDANESTLEKQCYRKKITKKEFYLRDHQILGEMVLPGVVYLEMAIAAGELAMQGSVVRQIQNILWARPIVLKSDFEVVSINLYPAEDGVNFEITTETINKQSMVHSSGKLGYLNPEVATKPSKVINLDNIKKRCPVIKEGLECYKEFSQIGFHYGKSFQPIRELYCNDHECLSRLELAAFLENDFPKYVLHPSLFDGALQTVIGLTKMLAANSNMLYLPFALEEVEIVKPLLQKCYAYITSSSIATGELKKFNIQLTDEAGEILIHLKGFSLKASQSVGTVLLTDHTATYQRIYYQYNWDKMELIIPSDNQPLGDTLIFDTQENIFSDLYATLQSRNDHSQVILVMPGSIYRERGPRVYEINTNDPQSYQNLLSDLLQKNIVPRNIIHLWSQGSFTPQESFIGDQLSQGIYSILYLSQSLIKQKTNRNVRLLYVYQTRDKEPQPLCAAMGAFFKALRLENPGLNYQTMEIRTTSDRKLSDHSHDFLNLVLQELYDTKGASVELRYEGKTRFVKQLSELEFKAESKPSVILRDKGVYLITGGASGLGLIFAGYLAKQVKAKLVLVGRSGSNPKMEQNIQALEAMGAEVMYVQADITKRKDTEELFQKAKARFSQIHGIIHSAGVIRDSFVLNKTSAEINAVLASKIYGTVNLHEVTQAENLDFFVLFSSTSAIIGSMGQSDYAYANSFMDYFAELRIQRKLPGKTLSINWPLWEHGGMAINDNSKTILKQMGLVSLSDADGIKAFEDGLSADISQLILFAGEHNKINDFLSRGWTTPLSHDDSSKKELGVQANKNEVESYLKNLLSKEIKLPVYRIESDDLLEKYGIDSVVVLNLTRALENYFGELSKTLFYEYKSIAELAEYFIKNHPEKISAMGNQLVRSHENAKSTNLQEHDTVSHRRFIAPNFHDAYSLPPVGEEIAIIGISGRYPMAEDLDEFWANLQQGKDCITEIPQDRWLYQDYYHPDKDQKGKSYSKWGGFISDCDKFDPLFFNISPREAIYIDPQERLFLEIVWQTLEDAGYTRVELAVDKVGVFVGVMYGHYQLFGMDNVNNGEHDVPPGSSYASIANRVSYYYNFRGPSIALDTMCSSSLTALHLACDSIHNGESEVAIAGGVNLTIHPNKYLHLSQGNFLASDGRCRSFGEGGDGYVPGEGVGAVLLKPLRKAIADGDQIYAVIKGSSVNHGGKTNGYTVPNPNAQAELIAEVLKKAKVDPRTISYIEAHGTGTSLGDPIEITGLVKAFGEYTQVKQYCAIGSVKSNIGHLESAAGIAGITKLLMQMKYKQLVPSLHSEQLNPHINFKNSPFYVQHELMEWTQPVIEENGIAKQYPRRAGISAFGAGGSNTHIILEEYEDPGRTEKIDLGEQIFVFSARNEEQLKSYAQRMVEFLKKATVKRTSANAIRTELLDKAQKDIVRITSELLHLSEVEVVVTDEIDEYGLDRIGLENLAGRINEVYNLEISATLFSEYHSLSTVTQYLLQEYRDVFECYYRQPDETAPEIASEHEPISLADIAFTLQVGREAMEVRMGIIAATFAELISRLTGYCQRDTDSQDVYTGNIRENKLKSDLLTTDQAGQEFLRAMMRERKFNNLAQLWVSGVEIDWKQLYSYGIPRRISLPTYPFAQERYWVPKTDKQSHGLLIGGLHPLIDSNISSFSEQKYTTRLRDTETSLFANQILGQKILFNFTILEMVRAAGDLASEFKVQEISNIVFSRLIELIDASNVEIALYPEGTRFEWEVRTVNQRNRKTVCAQGELSYMNETPRIPIETIDIEAIKGKCSSVAQAKFYQIIKTHGLEYGPGFKVIEEFYADENEALARLELTETLKSSSNKYVLHPALMEGVLQTLTGWIASTGITAGNPVLPHEVGKMEIWKPLTSKCYAYVRTSNEPAEQGKKNYEAMLTTETGEVLVKIAAIKLTTVAIHSRGISDVAEEQGHYAHKVQYILEKSWRESGSATFNTRENSGVFIILVNEEIRNFADQLFTGQDIRKIIIQSATNYQKRSGREYDINFYNTDHGVQVVREIMNQKVVVTGLIDLSDLHSQPTETCRVSMGKISMLQELIKNTNLKPFYILHLTQGLQTFQTVQATIAGADLASLVKMLGAEYQKIQSKTIDVDLSWDKMNQLTRIINSEIEINDFEGEVCYREGKRYIAVMHKIDLNDGQQERMVITPEKVIVITGGTRGIGSEIAKHLVNKGVRKLVLMGVQELPQRDQWSTMIQDPGANQAIVTKLKMMLALEEKGAQLELYTGSLIQKKELTLFFQGVRERMGEIGGVIHCAGLSMDKNPAFIHKASEDMRKIFEPKIEGLAVLHEIFRRDQLEFFVLFSSVSGLIPVLGSGLSDYAAANAFMDYFAAFQYKKGNTYYKSINWPVWTEVGMGETIAPIYRQFGLTGLTISEGLELLFKVINQRQRVVVMPCIAIEDEFNSDILLWVRQERKRHLKSTKFKASEVLPGTVTMEMKRKLKQLFSEELNIPEDKLNETTNFGDYGVDSVLLAELVKKVEVTFGRKLDPSVFLEYPTLQMLGSYLDRIFAAETQTVAISSESIQVRHEDERLRIEFEQYRSLTTKANQRGRIAMESGNSEVNGNKIAVIGMACHFPGANDKESYWANLAAGKSSVIEVPQQRWDINRYYAPEYQKGKSISKWGGFIDGIEYFDPGYFNIGEVEAVHIDPSIRQFMEISVQTLRDAGYEKEELWNKKVGVFVGSRIGNYSARIRQPLKNSVIGIGQNFIAAHVSHFFNFKGANMVIDTACSSSIVSIHLACQSLIMQESELAIAGGVDILLDEKSYIALSEGRALSPDGKCHTFDENANGFVPGEGCGAVLLKPLEKAIRDGDQIYAVIDASAVNNDGHTMGITTPNPEAQSEVIREALNRGGINPSTVSYVETHGTGTMIGDPIELKALTKIYRQSTPETQFCGVGSVKSNFGHLLSAAGIASFIKVVLAVWHKQLPPTLNCETPNPRFEFASSPFYPVTELRDWKSREGIRRAGISSFGFGGTNAHVIVAECGSELLKQYQQRRFSLAPVQFNRKVYWLDKIDDDQLLGIHDETDQRSKNLYLSQKKPELLEIIDETK